MNGTAVNYHIKIEGQTIPVPPEIGSSDEQIRETLSLYFEGIKNSKIERTVQVQRRYPRRCLQSCRDKRSNMSENSDRYFNHSRRRNQSLTRNTLGNRAVSAARESIN